MAWQEEPFRFLNFKECLPDKLRFWVYLLFLFVFQFSNGMYFTAMSQMQGEQSISINDVKMMSHAVLIGLTLYFPLAFRLKFRFTNRTSLIIAATGLLICNLLVPHIDKPFILVIIGFVAGFFRLYGTFECFSNILPKITPTYNYPVFLSFVFFVVLGVIHLFDALSMQIIYFFDWKQLHNLAVCLLLVVIVSAFLLMRPFRAEAKMPLLGIDFLGMLLWAIFILSLIFVVQYGNTLDWFHSPYIRVATGSAFVSLGFNIARINYIRHPFLEAAAFKVNNLGNLLIAFLCLAILLASKNTLQNTFTAAILHLDTLNLSKLKYFEFFGSVFGCGFFLVYIGSLEVVSQIGNLCRLFDDIGLCVFDVLFGKSADQYGEIVPAFDVLQLRTLGNLHCIDGVCSSHCSFQKLFSGTLHSRFCSYRHRFADWRCYLPTWIEATDRQTFVSNRKQCEFEPD